ncbi:hypothetical protein EZS27_013981, partial [termite gut metagenome]
NGRVIKPILIVLKDTFATTRGSESKVKIASVSNKSTSEPFELFGIDGEAEQTEEPVNNTDSISSSSLTQEEDDYPSIPLYNFIPNGTPTDQIVNNDIPNIKGELSIGNELYINLLVNGNFYTVLISYDGGNVITVYVPNSLLIAKTILVKVPKFSTDSLSYVLREELEKDTLTMNLGNPIEVILTVENTLGKKDFETIKNLKNLTKLDLSKSTNTFIPDSVFVTETTFYLCQITLPNKCTVINPRAFYGCIFLEKIIGFENIREIKEEAFSGCILLDVELPKNLKVLEKKAFYGCSGLKKIEIPYDIQEIEESVFENAGHPDGIFRFPYHVLLIKKAAFKNSNFECSLTFPEYMNSVEEEAFQGSKFSGHLEITVGMCNFGNRAFDNMNNIRSFGFNGNIFRIIGGAKEGDYVFYSRNCVLINFGIPFDPKEKNIKQLGISSQYFDNLFKTNYTDEELNVGIIPMVLENVQYYVKTNGLVKLSNIEDKKISNTNLIGCYHFFENLDFEGQYLNRHIQNYFAGYAMIYLHDNVSVPQNVLKTFVKNKEQEISIFCENNVDFATNSFSDVNLEKIEIVEGTTSIRSDFLSKNTGIPKDIFLVLNNYNNIDVSQYAFTDVDKEEALSYVLHAGNPKVKIVKNIAFNVLQITEPIERAYLSEPLTIPHVDEDFIGHNVRYNDRNLFANTPFKEIIFPFKQSVENPDVYEGTLKSIEDNAFADNPYLDIIIGLENVESLGTEIFSYTPNIHNLSFSKVKNIKHACLAHSCVTSINFYGSPLNGNIENNTFAVSPYLMYVNFENTKLTEIKDYMFAYCTNLMMVITGQNTNKSTNRYTNHNFIGGQTWNIERDENGNPIYDENGKVILKDDTETVPYPYYPNSSISYIDRIGIYAFSNCPSLKINVPSSVRIIDGLAFQNCEYLEIGLNEGLESIGQFAFWNCNGLIYVNMPRSVRSIGKGAFKTRSPFHAIYVNYNWERDEEIIPYSHEVYPLGQVFARVPDDYVRPPQDVSTNVNYGINMIHSAMYYDKGYGKKRTISKMMNQIELKNWEKKYGKPIVNSEGFKLSTGGHIISKYKGTGPNGGRGILYTQPEQLGWRLSYFMTVHRVMSILPHVKKWMYEGKGKHHKKYKWDQITKELETYFNKPKRSIKITAEEKGSIIKGIKVIYDSNEYVTNYTHEEIATLNVEPSPSYPSMENIDVVTVHEPLLNIRIQESHALPSFFSPQLPSVTLTMPSSIEGLFISARNINGEVIGSRNRVSLIQFSQKLKEQQREYKEYENKPEEEPFKVPEWELDYEPKVSKPAVQFVEDGVDAITVSIRMAEAIRTAATTSTGITATVALTTTVINGIMGVTACGAPGVVGNFANIANNIGNIGNLIDNIGNIGNIGNNLGHLANLGGLGGEIPAMIGAGPGPVAAVAPPVAGLTAGAVLNGISYVLSVIATIATIVTVVLAVLALAAGIVIGFLYAFSDVFSYETATYVSSYGAVHTPNGMVMIKPKLPTYINPLEDPYYKLLSPDVDDEEDLYMEAYIRDENNQNSVKEFNTNVKKFKESVNLYENKVNNYNKINKQISYDGSLNKDNTFKEIIIDRKKANETPSPSNPYITIPKDYNPNED